MDRRLTPFLLPGQPCLLPLLRGSLFLIVAHKNTFVILSGAKDLSRFAQNDITAFFVILSASEGSYHPHNDIKDPDMIKYPA